MSVERSHVSILCYLFALLPVGDFVYLVGTRDVVVSALLLDPGGLPDGPVAALIEVAGQNGQQWNQVEHGEHADTNHELHQLFLVFLLQRDLHADSVESSDTCQQQDHAHLETQT